MSLGRLFLSFKCIYDANLKMWGRKERQMQHLYCSVLCRGNFYECEVDDWSRGKQKIKSRQLIKNRTGGMFNMELMMQDVCRHISGHLLCCMSFFGIIFKGGCLMFFTTFDQRYRTGSRRVLPECQNLLPLLISNLFYSNISSSSYPFLTPFPQ